ncbi:hypothetical protein ACP275_04G073300 [Erythranthe tilingii]
MDKPENSSVQPPPPPPPHDRLIFTVNGERFEVPEVDPSTTLLEFLRTNTPFKSAKLGCGEGGCGACVVLLSKQNPNPNLNQIEHFTVSSCLTLLCSVNNCSITTNEGLGSSKDGIFHPIHERFSGFHASQCGFCTPGMCMSLFSAIINSEKDSNRPSKSGFSKLTVSEAEKSISGNLCRCTGYRPIVDACKSFASDVDLEDLGVNSFWRKKRDSIEKVNLSRLLPHYNPKDHASSILKDGYNFASGLLNSERHSWYTPLTIEELQMLLLQHSDRVVEKNGNRIKMVVGNTSNGYYKETEKYDKYIDLRYILELSVVRKDSSGIEFGAAISISKVISYLKQQNCESDLICSKVANHLEKIGSEFVRNSASMGGNLVMAQRKYFPSDITTLLVAVDSTVTILTGQNLHDKPEKITIEEFLQRPPMGPTDVLLSVHIPFIGQTKNEADNLNSRFMFESYRASPRPLGNALPYLNAAFLADISETENGVLVNYINLAFGAYGTKRAKRASRVEEYLSGKLLSVAVLNEAVELVKSDVASDEGTSYGAYRSSLAVGFLFQFLNTFSGDLSEDFKGSLLLEGSDRSKNIEMLSSAKQVVESSRDFYPVGEPMKKIAAAIQASDDIPSPPNCLYGAFIYSTKPSARINNISFNSNTPTAIISAKDIPEKGENIGSTTIFASEPLFSPDFSRCAGDRIAFVVAGTQKSANVAAKTAVLDYDTRDLDPPILTVEEAVERSSFFEVPPFLTPSNVGDFDRGMSESDHKIVNAEIKLGSQYYFYLENQTALAIPDEDNTMAVYSSIQNPEYAQIVIARCLGIPEHNVRVITRRVGGGFGGKAMKAIPVATACALAAHKLRRPVRTYLDRKTDMILAGGRHPMKITYTVGFKSNGKITALHLNILIDAGVTEDSSILIPHNIISSLKKYDFGALSFDLKLCKTNRTSKSAMRGPGEVQGSYIAEAIIENIASHLSIKSDDVRTVNMHEYETLKLFYGSASEECVDYTLPFIWDKVAESSSYFSRACLVEGFNKSNVWIKRGISRVPIVHELILRPAAGKVSVLWDGSIVVEVGGIELGQGLWTKVKQVAAYALGSIKCGEIIDKIRVVQADTLSLVQGGLTAASTTSESSCEAVRICCNLLVERLAPLREKLEEEIGIPVNWETLILQAHFRNINLGVNSYFVPDSSSSRYLNYGAAVSEVEVNILTGETRILRTDIVYDCGQSMNPAVDLGQIEGAFVQGLGFFMQEEYLTNAEGLVVTDSTWNYKIPTIDTIPKQFNVEVLNSGHHQNRILSSKASGEPPLLLAASVHCATRAAIGAAREQMKSWGAVEGVDSSFQLDVPATMPVVKQLCGLNVVETYLQSLIALER